MTTIITAITITRRLRHPAAVRHLAAGTAAVARRLVEVGMALAAHRLVVLRPARHQALRPAVAAIPAASRHSSTATNRAARRIKRI